MVYQVANEESLKEYLTVRPGEIAFLQTKPVDPKDYGREVKLLVGDVAFDAGTLDDDQMEKLLDLLGVKTRPIISIKGAVDVLKFFR